MLAIELIKKYIKPELQDAICVIAIGNGVWWHIHRDEELPDSEWAIALRVNNTI